MKNPIKWLLSLFKDNKDKTRHVVEIVNRLKELVDSEQAFRLVDAIPGDWDNELRDKLGVILKEVVRAITMHSTPEIAIRLIKSRESIRTRFLRKLAGHTLSRHANIPVETATIKAQEYYKENWK